MYNVPFHIANPNRKHAQHGSSTNAPDCTAPYPPGLLPTDIGRRREQVAAKAKAGANTGGIQLPHYNCCCYCCYCYRTSHTLIHSHTHTHTKLTYTPATHVWARMCFRLSSLGAQPGHPLRAPGQAESVHTDKQHIIETCGVCASCANM